MIVRRAVVASGVVIALLFLTGTAQAAPPACPDVSLTTAPGQRLALSATPCTDPDPGDTYTLGVHDMPMHGALSPAVVGSNYDPTPGYHGTDRFTYQAQDSHGELSNVATVDILIDTAPACTDGTATVESGKSLTIADLPCHDADADDFDEYFDDPGHGTIDIDNATGALIYTPAAGYTGSDSFTYFAQDIPWGQVSLGQGTMTITVTAPPQPTPLPSVVPPTPVAQPRDTTPPTFSLRAPAVKLKSALAKGLGVAVTSAEPGNASVTITVDRATARKLRLDRKAKHPVKVGAAKGVVAAGKTTLAVKFTAKARKALKHVRRVKLSVAVTVVDAAGNRSAHTLAVTLRR
jgi:Bacterial Ig domain